MKRLWKSLWGWGSLCLLLAPALSANEADKSAWEAEVAREALREGLFTIAEPLLIKALSNTQLAAEKDALLLDLADLSIARGKNQEAEKYLEQIKTKRGGFWNLRKALLSWRAGNKEAFHQHLKDIEVQQLSQEDLPWFYFLQFVKAYHFGSTISAEQYLQKAYEHAEGTRQFTQLELLTLREKFLARQEDKTLEVRLQRELESAEKGREYAEFLAYLATVKFRLGKKAEALKLLLDYREKEEENTPAELLILEGFITEDALKSQNLWARVLDKSKENKGRFLALSLMANQLGEDDDKALLATFKEKLDAWLKQDWEDPFRRRLLLLHTYLQIKENKLDEARGHLNELVKVLPKGELLNSVLRARAYLSWREKHYRLAADDLSKLRAESQDPKEVVRLGQLMGSCYYLNGDYMTAGDLYASLSKRLGKEESSQRARLLYQALVSYLKAHDTDRALSVLKGNEGLRNEEFFWRARYVLVEYLARAGKLEVALKQLHEDGEPPLEFRNLFYWLHARLEFAKGHYEKALSTAKGLLKQEAMGKLETNMAAELLLLYARSLLYVGKTSESFALMKDLRERYKGSDAAIFSHLEEAHYTASQFKLGDGVEQLRRLGDLYPDSPYAPVALYEAAILASRQGLETGNREAITILNALIEKYPRPPVGFFSQVAAGQHRAFPGGV